MPISLIEAAELWPYVARLFRSFRLMVLARGRKGFTLYQCSKEFIDNAQRYIDQQTRDAPRAPTAFEKRQFDDTGDD